MYSTRMALQIPPRLLETVLQLFRLSAPKRDALLDAMLAIDPNVGGANYEVYLNEKFSEHSSEWVTNFVTFVLSFYNVGVGENFEATASDFVEALQTVDDDEIRRASPQKFEEFRTFAVRILSSSDSLGVSAKATRLMYDNERTYIASSVMSDIRSVFPDDDSTDSPSAAVIIHSLRVHYRKGSEHKDFFVHLDFGDLISLYDTVERAMEKHQTLANKLNDFGLPAVKVGGFDE